MSHQFEDPKPYEIYRHFRGKIYQITALAKDADTGRDLVVYQALYSPFRIWVRPLSEFTEELDPVKYPEADQQHRFERVGESGQIPESTGDPENSSLRERSRNGCGYTRIPDELSDRTEVETEPETEMTGENFRLDPMVEKFMDADSTRERINILTAVRPRITDDMIDMMSIAAGIEIGPGDPEERWADLRECLETVRRYEQSRSTEN